MDRKKIKNRLMRLLAMTVENGATEAEALAAAEKAAKLMSEHNLSYRTVEEIEAEAYSDNRRDWFRGAKGRRRSTLCRGDLYRGVSCLRCVWLRITGKHVFQDQRDRPAIENQMVAIPHQPVGFVIPPNERTTHQRWAIQRERRGAVLREEIGVVPLALR